MGLFWFFVVLSIVNVIGGTIKSILTVNGNRIVASLTNAFYFGFYTVVLVYMNCDLTLWQKVAVTAVCNFIGVFIVKSIEQKMRKDRLWKIEFTVKNADSNVAQIDSKLESMDIPHGYNVIGKHTMFSCYCATQSDSVKVRELIESVGGKYFVSEGKSLY